MHCRLTDQKNRSSSCGNSIAAKSNLGASAAERRVIPVRLCRRNGNEQFESLLGHELTLFSITHEIRLPSTFRQSPDSRRGTFKGLRADVTEVTVTPGPIVKRFDVSKDIGLGQIMGFADPLADALLFQAAEESLGYRIVPAVAATARARLQLIAHAKTSPIVAAIPTAMIRIDQHLLRRLSAPHRHQ